jgi:hypothetical protein
MRPKVVEADVGGSEGDRESEEGKAGTGLISEATGTVDLTAGYWGQYWGDERMKAGKGGPSHKCTFPKTVNRCLACNRSIPPFGRLRGDQIAVEQQQMT